MVNGEWRIEKVNGEWKMENGEFPRSRSVSRSVPVSRLPTPDSRLNPSLFAIEFHCPSRTFAARMEEGTGQVFNHGSVLHMKLEIKGLIQELKK